MNECKFPSESQTSVISNIGGGVSIIQTNIGEQESIVEFFSKKRCFEVAKALMALAETVQSTDDEDRRQPSAEELDKFFKGTQESLR